jgi:hypothetical protein
MRSIAFLAAIVVLAASVVALNELRFAGLLSLTVTAVAAWSAFFINLALAMFGAIGTSYKPLWIAYVVVSLAAMILIGAPTPLNAIWIVLR